MAKKSAKKGSKKKSKVDTEALKKQALESAHKVWLAGLGALAVAEDEGSKLFGKLVDKGTELEKRGKPVVEKLGKQVGRKVEAARAEAGSRAEKVGDDAKAAWGKVEAAVEDKVSAALHKLGIPTRDEIESLTKRVEALTEKLGAAGSKPARTRSAKKKAASKTKKPAAKKAARKKPAKKVARRPAKKAARRPAASAAPAATPESSAASS